MAIVGALCLVSGVGFLMYLIVRSLEGEVVPCSQRYLVGATLGLLLALGSGFLGARGAIRGSLPFEALNEHPLRFSLVGGAAVFLIVFLLFPLAGSCPDEKVLSIDSVEPRRKDGNLVVVVGFTSSPLAASERLLVSVGDEEEEWLTDREIDARIGQALLALTDRGADRVCVQLKVRDDDEILRRKGPVCVSPS